jgi:hypothetical protein
MAIMYVQLPFLLSSEVALVMDGHILGPTSFMGPREIAIGSNVLNLIDAAADPHQFRAIGLVW